LGIIVLVTLLVSMAQKLVTLKALRMTNSWIDDKKTVEIILLIAISQDTIVLSNLCRLWQYQTILITIRMAAKNHIYLHWEDQTEPIPQASNSKNTLWGLNQWPLEDSSTGSITQQSKHQIFYGVSLSCCISHFCHEVSYNQTPNHVSILANSAPTFTFSHPRGGGSHITMF